MERETVYFNVIEFFKRNDSGIYNIRFFLICGNLMVLVELQLGQRTIGLSKMTFHITMYDYFIQTDLWGTHLKTKPYSQLHYF